VRGSLKAVGRIDELVSRDIPYWEVALQGVKNGSLPCGQVVSRRDDRLLVRVESQADMHRNLSTLNGGGAQLVSVTPGRQSLEDLFIREARASATAPAESPERHAR